MHTYAKFMHAHTGAASTFTIQIHTCKYIHRVHGLYVYTKACIYYRGMRTHKHTGASIHR
jgi:hypothetical protein